MGARGHRALLSLTCLEQKARSCKMLISRALPSVNSSQQRGTSGLIVWLVKVALVAFSKDGSMRLPWLLVNQGLDSSLQ